MIKAFLWKATPEDRTLVSKLIKAAFDEEPLLHDCMYDGETEKNLEGVLLAFGVRCFNIISSSTNSKVHQLTTPAKLKPSPANKKNRIETFEALKKIAENKVDSSGITLTDKDLEKLLPKQLIVLQKTLKQKKQEVWKGTTSTGKTLALTLKPNTEVKDCEIVLTFEELFAAKYAVEALGIDYLTLIGSKDE